MKNKTLTMASALLIGGLLTFNSSVFADTVNTPAFTGARQKPALAGKITLGKLGNSERKPLFDMKMGGMQRQGLSIKLDALVTEGTITQSIADKIQAYITEQGTTIKAEMEKVKAMTEDERKAYFESKKSNVAEKKDILGTLVEKAVITQTESDAIKVAQQTKQAEQKSTQQEYTTTALNKLVESNVITSAQLIKINEHIAAAQATRGTEMEKIKAMTQEESVAYLKSNVGSKGNILTQLVTNNVLTQTQADAVEKALHSRGFSKDFGRGIIKK